jgi:hypothetical protein
MGPTHGDDRARQAGCEGSAGGIWLISNSRFLSPKAIGRLRIDDQA